mmetsp:Transcript_26894/g.44078  ORF Transcript_26894/g.44078 Transcript_26894/m.44078 type:complete len:237 (-) Transcript_26894:460-1170(-)
MLQCIVAVESLTRIIMQESRHKMLYIARVSILSQSLHHIRHNHRSCAILSIPPKFTMKLHFTAPHKLCILFLIIQLLIRANVLRTHCVLRLRVHKCITCAIRHNAVLSQQQFHGDHAQRVHINLLRVAHILALNAIEQFPRAIAERVAWNHALILRLHALQFMVVEHGKAIVNDEHVKRAIAGIARIRDEDIVRLEIVMNEVASDMQIMQLAQNAIHHARHELLFLVQLWCGVEQR